MSKRKIKITGAKENAPKVHRSKAIVASKSTPLNWHTDYLKEAIEAERNMWQPFTLLNKEMLLQEGKKPEAYPKWIDPATGKEVHGRIVSVKWLESYKNKIDNKVEEGVRQVNIKPNKLFERYAEDEKRLVKKGKKKFMENWGQGFAFGNDGNTSGLPFGDQVLYPPGPYTHQLYLQAMWNMQARIFEIKNHYGVAKGLINLITGFVIGEGVKVDLKDEKAQEIWDEFAERNNFEQRLPIHSDMLSGEGNLFWRVIPTRLNAKAGYSSLSTISAGTVWEKITDPKNIFDVKGYWVQYATQYQLFSVGGVPLADYVLEVVPPEEVIHTTINIYEDEKFGRSDLLSVLSDLKLLQDIVKYRAVRVINESALVFVQTIQGNDTDVSAISNVQTSFLGPGTTVTNNESVTFDIKQASATAQTKSGFQDEMLSQIGAGAGNLPSDYLGGGAGTNRANALTKVEPAYKFFKRRQKAFEFSIKKLVKKVLENAVKGGRLAESEDAYECEIIFPELAPEDKAEKMANIVLMEQQKYWDHEKAATTAAKEMDDTSYDYKETQEAVKKRQLEDPQLNMYLGAGMGRPNPGLPGAPSAKAPAAYGGDQSGMSSSTKTAITQDLKSKEANSQTAMPALMRKKTKHKMTKELFIQENATMPKSFQKIKWGGVHPPGWEPVLEAIEAIDEISDPTALSWYLSQQGYTFDSNRSS